MEAVNTRKKKKSLGKLLNLVFIPGSVIVDQIRECRRGYSEFKNKDYVTIPEMSFAGEQVIKFGAASLTEVTKGIIYSVALIKLMDYFQ